MTGGYDYMDYYSSDYEYPDPEEEALLREEVENDSTIDWNKEIMDGLDYRPGDKIEWQGEDDDYDAEGYDDELGSDAAGSDASGGDTSGSDESDAEVTGRLPSVSVKVENVPEEEVRNSPVRTRQKRRVSDLLEAAKAGEKVLHSTGGIDDRTGNKRIKLEEGDRDERSTKAEEVWIRVMEMLKPKQMNLALPHRKRGP